MRELIRAISAPTSLTSLFRPRLSCFNDCETIALCLSDTGSAYRKKHEDWMMELNVAKYSLERWIFKESPSPKIQISGERLIVLAARARLKDPVR